MGIAFPPKFYCKVCDARKQNCDLVKFFQLLGTELHSQEPLKPYQQATRKVGLKSEHELSSNTNVPCPLPMLLLLLPAGLLTTYSIASLL